MNNSEAMSEANLMKSSKNMTTHKEALNSPNGEAQPEQRSNEHSEPVAKYTGETWCGSVVNLYEDIPLNTLLYTTTPHRNRSATPHTWVGLTEDDIDSIHFGLESSFSDIVRAVEAKLKAKNERLEKNT